jgi:hypothetical protein
LLKVTYLLQNMQQHFYKLCCRVGFLIGCVLCQFMVPARLLCLSGKPPFFTMVMQWEASLIPCSDAR